MVNPHYAAPQMISSVKKAFLANRKLPSVTLQRYFSEKEYREMSAIVNKIAVKKKKDPLHYSYAAAAAPAPLLRLLNTGEILAFLKTAAGKGASVRGELLVFGWKDYTLLHDDAVEEPGVDVIIDFTPQWKSTAGGEIVYSDGKGETATIPPSPNTLSIVERKKGVQKFVRYCNHHAGKEKRILFFGTLR